MDEKVNFPVSAFTVRREKVKRDNLSRTEKFRFYRYVVHRPKSNI